MMKFSFSCLFFPLVLFYFFDGCAQLVRKCVVLLLPQDKLAEAGCVAEETLSSMTTVRSFAAESREEEQYSKMLKE